VSSRRNASLVVAVGVASLAATSFTAMVATSELLTESITHPVPEGLDPPVPDLGRPGVIQVEPPERGRAKRPGGRSREPAAPPPRRRSATRRESGVAASGDGGHAGVITAVQRRPARQRPAVLRTPAAGPPVARTPSARPPARPTPRPVRHPRQRADRPEPGSSPRPWRRPPYQHKDGVPSPPRPDTPRTAGPESEPSGGSPCPGRSGHEDHGDREHHHRDGDRGRWVGSPRDNDADGRRQGEDRRPEQYWDHGDRGGSDGDRHQHP
jgi:hypothetical protein